MNWGLQHLDDLESIIFSFEDNEGSPLPVLLDVSSSSESRGDKPSDGLVAKMTSSRIHVFVVAYYYVGNIASIKHSHELAMIHVNPENPFSQSVLSLVGVRSWNGTAVLVVVAFHLDTGASHKLETGASEVPHASFMNFCQQLLDDDEA